MLQRKKEEEEEEKEQQISQVGAEPRCVNSCGSDVKSSLLDCFQLKKVIQHKTKVTFPLKLGG